MKFLTLTRVATVILLITTINDQHARDFDFNDGIRLIREKHPERYQRIREFLQKSPEKINGWVEIFTWEWNSTSSKNTSIELSMVTAAMHTRDYEMIDLLVEFGVKPCTEKYGWCPAHAAEKYELHDMLDYLKQKMNEACEETNMRIDGQPFQVP